MSRLWRAVLRVRFRDVVIVTAPFIALFALLAYSSVKDFFDLAVRLEWPDYRTYNLRAFFKKNACDFLIFFIPRTTRFDQKTELPTIDIHIDKALLGELDGDLPASGRVYKDAFLRDERLNFHRVKFRYRGDFPWHWFFKKKSLRVKTSKDYLLYRQRILNFINPKTMSYVQGSLPYQVAGSLGILSPEVAFVRVFINNAYNGVHLYTDQVNESFLRKMKRMPGNIFNGDNPKGGNDFYPHLPADIFQVPQIWRKDAVDNKFPEDDRRELDELCRALYEPDRVKSLLKLERLLAREDWRTFLAYVSCIGSYHWDAIHNWKLYFDPSSGRFVPICWDPNGWHWGWRKGELDICNNTLFSMLMRDPRLVEEKNAELYRLVKDGGEGYAEEAARSYARIRRSCEEDPYKWGYLQPPFVTIEDVDKAVEAFKDRIREQSDYLEEMLGDAAVDVTLTKTGDGLFLLKLDSRGWAAARLEGVTLRSSGEVATLEVMRDMNRNGRADDGEAPLDVSWRSDGEEVSLDLEEVLYPGRVVTDKYLDVYNHLLRAPLSYIFLLRVPKGVELSVPSVRARNNITGAPAAVSVVDNPDIVSVHSVHPWDFPVRMPRTVTLAGREHRLDEDLVLERGDTLVIEAGATVRLAPGVSILSRGRVEASGTATEPIRFLPAEEGRPWGVVALQGDGADGSAFTHCVFEGGSKAYLERVFYTGMLSVFNASGVLVEGCSFIRNLMADDSLRAVHSNIDVTGCEFTYANGDAIDFDQSGGRIEDCRFLNTRNDAVDLMTSNPVIEGCYMYRSGDKGVSIGEASSPTISDCRIIECQRGIESKDNSDPLVTNCVIAGNNVGINCYKKNWRYGGGGKGRIEDSIVAANGVDFSLDKDSSLEVSRTCSTDRMTEKDRKRITFSDCRVIDAGYGELAANDFKVGPDSGAENTGKGD